MNDWKIPKVESRTSSSIQCADCVQTLPVDWSTATIIGGTLTLTPYNAIASLGLSGLSVFSPLEDTHLFLTPD